jgi:hypothetical protein
LHWGIAKRSVEGCERDFGAILLWWVCGFGCFLVFFSVFCCFLDGCGFLVLGMNVFWQKLSWALVSLYA